MTDTPGMRSLRLTPLWRPRSTLNTPSAFRVEVRPPSLRHAPATLGQRLLFWLMAPAPQEAAPPINRLPGDRRDLLLYKFGNRFSNLEIGKLLGRSEGAIKSLYFRTLAVLREDLESRGWEEEE